MGRKIAKDKDEDFGSFVSRLRPRQKHGSGSPIFSLDKGTNELKVSTYTGGFRGNTYIKINSDKQVIQIGEHFFASFPILFDFWNIKDTKSQSQKKGGVMLIYAITIHGLDRRGKMLISDLLEYCEYFKQAWNHRSFAKKGVKKETISQTDCDSANSILLKCDAGIRLKLSDDTTEILIIKTK